ncbi:MAG: hypothetical protein HY286_10130 [Planctomycetes bacterium]|nr:hypothetical protein [Planctomycetota bacterium]
MSRKPILLLILAIISIGFAGCDDGRVALPALESEREANRLMIALFDSNLSPKLTSVEKQRKVTWVISVPQSDSNERKARDVMDKLGLPAKAYGGFSGALSSGGLIPNKNLEKARIMNAIAEELSRTIEIMPGVVDARVHITIPEDKGPTLIDAASKAVDSSMKAVVYVNLNDLSKKKNLEDNVPNLVVGAVTGLDAAAVKLVIEEVKPPLGDSNSTNNDTSSNKSMNGQKAAPMTELVPGIPNNFLLGLTIFFTGATLILGIIILRMMFAKGKVDAEAPAVPRRAAL